MTDRVLADTDSANAEPVIRAYSHNVASAANLLAERGFAAEAEQAYRLSMQLWPGNPEPLGGLADLMIAQGNSQEALRMAVAFEQSNPGQRIESERLRLLRAGGQVSPP